MISATFMKRLRLAAIPVLAVAMQAAFAEAPKGHGDEAMKEYQAGGSPMADVPMHHDINPAAPRMSEPEFEKAKRIFFERCAG